MLSADAIRELLDAGRALNANQSLPSKDKHTARRLIDGEIKEFRTEPSVPKVSLMTVDDVVSWVRSGDSGGSLVLVNWDEIVAWPDFLEAPDEFASCRLNTSQGYMAMESRFGSLESMTQKAWLRLLRFDLAVPETDIAPWRSLDFARQSGGARTVEHGRESLGRTVETQVQGRQELPQKLEVRCSVFHQHIGPSEATVTLNIDLDLEDERVLVKAEPNAFVRANWKALSQITQSLVAGGLEADRVLYGMPA